MNRLLPFAFVLLSTAAWASSDSNGPNGIDSIATGLDGTGVRIGQGEVNRSAKFGYDTMAQFVASNTIPTGVYRLGTGGMDPPNPNTFLLDHATEVAGVMIGKDMPNANTVGVAPNAELHSMAIIDVTDDVMVALALNRLATLNVDVKAINLSFAPPLQPDQNPDGNSHMTQFIDWSAREHDVLYVVGWGNDEQPPIRKMQDNYNGITVASSERVDGVWRKWFTGNASTMVGDAHGDRTSIDLLAPGDEVLILSLNDIADFEDGTSIAAPHVTGTTALLQQYAKNQMELNPPNPRFGSNSQQPEVMKAVMLNSADKLSGVHGSTRTIVDRLDQDWTESEAYNSQFIPLDDDMGAGHLNARRAEEQFAPGEYSSSETIPFIGWDFGNIGGLSESVSYDFDAPLQAGQYIAITLAWDRRIESTGDDTYNVGDQFFNHAVANLDLQLFTDGGVVLAAQSISDEMNLEHIFFEIEDAGDYSIRVVHSAGDIGTPLALTDYALAWWYGNPAIPGDYDGSGSVGPEDYDLWVMDFGSMTNLDADGNGNGIIDAADYTVWRDNFGAGSGGATAAVPEPSAWMLSVLAAICWISVQSGTLARLPVLNRRKMEVTADPGGKGSLPTSRIFRDHDKQLTLVHW